MEREIFTSDKFTENFVQLAALLKKEYNIVIQLNCIKGERWQFLAGPAGADIPVGKHHRVSLGEKTGVVVYGLAELDEKFKERLVYMINSLEQ